MIANLVQNATPNCKFPSPSEEIDEKWNPNCKLPSQSEDIDDKWEEFQPKLQIPLSVRGARRQVGGVQAEVRRDEQADDQLPRRGSGGEKLAKYTCTGEIS